MEVGLANQIDCTIVRGHPKPSIKWTKKGESDVVLSEIDSLMFANPTEADQAVYCVEVCILSISGFLVIIIKYVTLCLKRWKMWRVLKGRRSVWKSKVVLWMSKTFFSSFPLQIQFCGCQKPFSSFPLQIILWMSKTFFLFSSSDTISGNEERFEKAFDRSKFPDIIKS